MTGNASLRTGPKVWAKRLDEVVWRTRAAEVPSWKRRAIGVTRIFYVLARDLFSGELTLRAMSLVYTTLLSLVPLLALSFSVLKGFGVHNQLQPMLAVFLEPLGDRGAEVTQRIMQFIENVNVRVLGAMGLALLIYTVISLMQKIETSFNFIWHVSQSRGFGERFSRYLSVLLVGPMLVFSAMGITAAVMSSAGAQQLLAWQAVEHAVGAAAALTPYLLVVGAFTFMYMFIPNTQVRLVPALIGGLVGGVMWQSAGWAFALFAGSSTQYAALYSGFAIVILFMIWLYVSWLVMLFGASVAFYVQYPQYVTPLGGEPRLSNRMRERIALGIAAHVAHAYATGAPPLTAEPIAQRMRVPAHSIAAVLDVLLANGLLIRAENNSLLPARDLSRVSVHELLGMVRVAGEDRYVNASSVAVPETVERVMALRESNAARLLEPISVADLADAKVASEPAASDKEAVAPAYPDATERAEQALR